MQNDYRQSLRLAGYNERDCNRAKRRGDIRLAGFYARKAFAFRALAAIELRHAARGIVHDTKTHYFQSRH